MVTKPTPKSPKQRTMLYEDTNDLVEPSEDSQSKSKEMFVHDSTCLHSAEISPSSLQQSHQRAELPEGWKYHPNNCVGAWVAWYHGSKADPPLRHIYIDDVKHLKSKENLQNTALVMQELIAATGLTEDAITIMRKDAFADTFNKAFEKLYPNTDPRVNITSLAPTSLPTISKLWIEWFDGKPKPWGLMLAKEMPPELQGDHSNNTKLVAKLCEVAFYLGLVDAKEAVPKLSEEARNAILKPAFQAFVAQSGPTCHLTTDSLCSAAKPFLQIKLDPEFRLGGKPFFPFMSIRTMWVRWFLGQDSTTSGIPYWRFKKWHEDSVDWIQKSKRGLDMLVQSALEHRLVESVKDLEAIQDEVALVDVFERALTFFRDQFVGSIKSRIHPLMFSSSVVRYLNPTCWKQHPDFVPTSQKEKETKESLQMSLSSTVLPADKSTPCHKMWWLWFRGDKRSEFVPFRHISSLSNASKEVMKALEDLVLDESFASSINAVETWGGKALMKLFDRVFPIFVMTFDTSVQSWIQPTTMCHVVQKHMTPALWRRHPNAKQN
ncbi:unnamed protein product [Aphanomyces euteiches]